jgi:hypothetical protein
MPNVPDLNFPGKALHIPVPDQEPVIGTLDTPQFEESKTKGNGAVRIRKLK